MMDVEAIKAYVDIGLPTALVVTGLWFGISKAWPYWMERDTVERQRRDDATKQSLQAEVAIAGALSVIADRLNGVVKVSVE